MMLPFDTRLLDHPPAKYIPEPHVAIAGKARDGGWIARLFPMTWLRLVRG